MHEKQSAEACTAKTIKPLYTSYSHYTAASFFAGPIKNLAEELLTTFDEI
jgi:hypothetical protein